VLLCLHGTAPLRMREYPVEGARPPFDLGCFAAAHTIPAYRRFGNYANALWLLLRPRRSLGRNGLHVEVAARHRWQFEEQVGTALHGRMVAQAKGTYDARVVRGPSGPLGGRAGASQVSLRIGEYRNSWDIEEVQCH